MSDKKINWKVLIIPTVLAVLVFAFSQSALWLGDEIPYNYSFKDNTQITSISDVVPSQIEHYKTINGRTVAHSLCQIYIPFLGKTAFAVSNALVWVALLLLMANLFSIKSLLCENSATTFALQHLEIITSFSTIIGFSKERKK